MLKLHQKIRFLHRACRYALRTERYELSLVRNLLRPGDTVIDIGSHKGVFTYWMAKRIGAGGRVIAFEPIPFLAEYLHDVTQWLKEYSIEVHQCALSDQIGKDVLYFPGDHLGSASLEKKNTVMREPIIVSKTTLDAMIAKSNCESPIAFIKCDVENHELAVFKGAEQTLSSHQPMLLFESGNLDDGRDLCEPTFEFLEGLGYQGTFIDRGTLIDIRDFDRRIHDVPSGENQNFLFTHPDTAILRKRTHPARVLRNDQRQFAA